MDSNSKIVSTYNVVQNESEDLCLIDPMILLSIIVSICLILYIIGFKLSKEDNK